jgi:hypothetical protein
LLNSSIKKSRSRAAFSLQRKITCRQVLGQQQEQLELQERQQERHQQEQRLVQEQQLAQALA